MEFLGIEDSMRLAHAHNQGLNGEREAFRRQLYRESLDELLAENGGSIVPGLEMKDGWAMDRSGTLPHLDRLLEQCDRIIEGRSGTRVKEGTSYRSYFQDILDYDSDPGAYPGILDFATSSALLSVIARHVQSIPVLSTTLPSGIRLIESNAKFDDRPDAPHDSQLYHIDYYALPLIYVIVLCRDTTIQIGRAHV